MTAHSQSCLKVPVGVHGLDRPVKFLPQCLGEELLNGNIELLGEDHRKARVNVVLVTRVSE